MSLEYAAKRADMLLRLHYLGLETVIYELSESKYSIFCKEYVVDFKEISKKFRYEFVAVTHDINVTNVAPEVYVKKIEAMDLNNPVCDFKAVAYTYRDILELIRGLFPKVNILKIEVIDKPKWKLKVFVDKGASQKQCNEIETVLAEKELFTDEIIVERTDGEETIVKKIDPINLRMDKKILCTVEETEYWFANAEKIYMGKVKREDIPYYKKSSTNCFLDFTVFDGINLRQAILLYDTIYMALPIGDGLRNFLLKQGITKEDIIRLVTMGKMVVVLTNDEYRYDLEFINDLYREAPQGVISRRAINTLIAAYLTELNQRYLSNYPNAHYYASDYYKYSKEKDDEFLMTLANLMAWPILAKARSFQYLNKYSFLTVHHFGVNNFVEDCVVNLLKQNVEEKGILTDELNFHAHSIHLAMALNSTYIPFEQIESGGKVYSDYIAASMIEKLLTMYWYSSSQLNYISVCKSTEVREQLKIFDCNPYVSVIKIAEGVEKYKTNKIFREILMKLNSLTIEERDDLIREYTNLLSEVAMSRTRMSIKDYVFDFVGNMPIPWLATLAITGVKYLCKYVEDAGLCDKNVEQSDFESKIQMISGNKYTAKELEDIFVLDRMHRVAGVRLMK